MLSQKINKATYKTLRFVQENQSETGDFMDSPAIFANSIILRCLDSVKSFSISQELMKKGTGFLLDKKSKNWSWNYWFAKSNCPDDLDDTFSALSAINLFDDSLITGEAFAYISRNLIICETETGGPYNTWLYGNSLEYTWQDIDIVVNSNIAYFLKLKDVKMPQLIEYTEKTIRDSVLNGKYESKYYDDLVVLYFISRWYTGNLSKTIRNQTLKLRNSDGNWGNQLRNALAISVLTNTETPPEVFIDSVKDLVDSMNKFDPSPFYIESIKSWKPKYFESASLTAALCVEAVNLFEDKYLSENNSISNTQKSSDEEIIHEKIIAKVRECINLFPGNTRTLANKILDRIKKDKQITLTSSIFANCLGTNNFTESSIELGTANLYGWVAYTIYDNILDGEKSDLLPIANICLMNALDIYKTVNNGNIKTISKELIIKMELSNAWEKEFCHIDTREKISKEHMPVYKDHNLLADKSMPHALGPISIMISKGDNPLPVIEFFRHYLIAKQLNDDAHDWLEDMRRGFVNSVGSMVLAEYFDTDNTDFLLERDKQKLSELFRYKVLDTVAINILLETSKARESIEKISDKYNKSYLKNILKPLENSANTAIAERNSIMKFLSVYQKSN